MVLQAAFALPSTDDGFTVIDYVEMPESESRREIRRINEEGRAFKANNPGLVRIRNMQRACCCLNIWVGLLALWERTNGALDARQNLCLSL